MLDIVVVDREGRPHAVSAVVGDSLMRAIRAAGLPISAVCGGGLSCATCHVYAEGDRPGQLPARSDGEEILLEAVAHFDPDRSRLACQIQIAAHLQGLRVELAPEDW